MSDVYRDTDHRYLTDPAFHAVVKMLERAATEHGFTPGELKQMAFKAALNIEERRPVERFVKAHGALADTRALVAIEAALHPADRTPPWPGMTDEVAPWPGSIAGRLKDGTPVYFGREP